MNRLGVKPRGTRPVPPVDQLVDDSEETIVVTSLSVIEIASVFHRKYNRGEITETQRDGLLVSFFEKATDRFVLVPVDEQMFENAFDLVLEDNLRTLKSFQLAVAVSLPTPNPEITFACAVDILLRLKTQESRA